MKKLLITAILATFVFANDVYAIFTVEPISKSTASIDARGIVENIHVKIGDHVKKGELLLELENSELTHSKAISLAELESLEVELDYAKKSLERFKGVQDVIDKESFEASQYKVNMIESKIKISKASIAYKDSLIKKTKLYAPINGVISAKYVDVGEMPNGKCFEIQNTNKVKIVLSFDEKYWSVVKKGQIFEYKIDGITKLFKGEISKIYPTVEAGTRMIKAEVVASGIKSGLFGDGYIRVK